MISDEFNDDIVGLRRYDDDDDDDDDDDLNDDDDDLIFISFEDERENQI